MSLMRVSSMKRWALGCSLAVATALAGANSPEAGASSGVSAPSQVVRQSLAGAMLAGEGQMRFLGLRIYDARLWVTPRFEAQAFGAHPLALELTYHRAFTGAAIAQRSMEEIKRQSPLAPAQAERWQQRLTELLPDVQQGDRLTGVYQPGQGMRLWRGSQELGAIDDAELGRLFFGIWLSPRTSEPGLRSALLARSPVGTP
ncbi:chalcone isomerase family protein [bacterium BD-1]|nr:chalcone isomerase family protein [Ottowia caeni]